MKKIIALVGVATLMVFAVSASAQYAPYRPRIDRKAMEALRKNMEEKMKLIASVPVMVSINEVMANSPVYGEDSGEYVELHNFGDWPVDISQWTIGDGEDTDHLVDYNDSLGLEGFVIPAGGYALIVDPDTNVGSLYGDDILDAAEENNFIIVAVDDDAIGNGLDNSGETITVTTNRPAYSGGKQKRTCYYGYSIGSAYEGTVTELCNGEYTKKGIPSPCGENWCE